MSDNRANKGGFTVHEIEHMVKKYRFEVFFCGSFLLAGLFSMIFENLMGYSILLTVVGAIVGALMAGRIEHLMNTILEFICKQEKITRIIIGVVLLILSIVVSPVIFAMIGLAGGQSLHHHTLIQRGKFLREHDSDKDSTRGHS